MNDNISFYEAFARYYVEYYGHMDANEVVHQWVIRLKGLGLVADPISASSLRLLDLGCGPGWHLRTWQNAGFEVSGMDVSPSMLKLASVQSNAGVGTDILLYCADIRDTSSLQSLRGSFDVVVCHFNFLNLFEVLELPLVFAGIRRMLSKGGTCMVDVTFPDERTGAYKEGQEIEEMSASQLKRSVSLEGRRIDQQWVMDGRIFHESYWLHTQAELETCARGEGHELHSISPWLPNGEPGGIRNYGLRRVLLTFGSAQRAQQFE